MGCNPSVVWVASKKQYFCSSDHPCDYAAERVNQKLPLLMESSLNPTFMWPIKVTWTKTNTTNYTVKAKAYCMYSENTCISLIFLATGWNICFQIIYNIKKIYVCICVGGVYFRVRAAYIKFVLPFFFLSKILHSLCPTVV